jgi:hypothetical protein
MIRGFTTIVTALLVVGAARASPYWVEYEPGNGLYPEEDGWHRFFSHGGSQRSFDGGWLVMDSMASPNIEDYYSLTMTDGLDPGPAEEFVMQWRIRIDELEWYYDPGVSVYSDERWAVLFAMNLTTIESLFEPGVFATYEPQVEHAFELRSTDMQTYVLSIDGVPAIHGNFWDAVSNASTAIWGDSGGGASLARWDYFRFGVVPECDSFLLTSSATVLLVLLRTRTGR